MRLARAAALLGFLACAAPPPSTGELAGAVAVVGDQRLEATTFDALQRARPGDPPRALVDAWVRAALLAQAALDQHVLHEGRSPALVRRLIADWTARAAIPAEATAEDIASARADDWQRFDRGPSVVVHHAVFMKTRAATESFDTDAMQLARTFAAQVERDWDFERFSAAAKAIPLPPGIEVRAEQLPAFVADGRATEGPSGFDTTFARQAFTLQKPGDSTPAFATSFGVHVVQLEKQNEAVRPSDQEVRAALQPELIGRRVRKRQSEALGRQQPLLEVQLSATASADMAAVVARLLEPAEGTRLAERP